MLKKHESYDWTGKPVVCRDTSHESHGPVVCNSSNTRQMGCVFQDMEPPKSSSILWKSSDDTETDPTCKVHKSCCTSRMTFDDQNPSLGLYLPRWTSSAVAPTLQNLRIGLKRRREWQEQGAREAAWKLAKSVLIIKGRKQSHIHLTFGKIGACLHQLLNLRNENLLSTPERRCIWSAKKDLNDAEMDTLTKSCTPTIVITANGEVQTHEEATVYVKELDMFLTMKVLENTPAVLSLGKLCDENGYSNEWINSQKTTSH